VGLFPALLLVLGPLAGGAEATNGYFSHGYGTKQKGMAGAGAALPLNTLAAATNPAVMAFVGKRYDVGISLFNPNREYSITGAPSGFPGTFGLTPGTVESDSRYFPIPSFGANWKIDDDSTFGLVLYANGGMNTDYPTSTFYGSSPTGVDLAQVFVAPTYAHKLGAHHALGVAVLGAYQRFQAQGLQAFGGFSADRSHLTDNGHNNSVGGGARFGYYGEWSSVFSVGASYQTKVKMTKFDNYAGLFAQQGGFDIPATWTAGVAIKPTGAVAIAFDVQQILYSGIKSVGNPLLPGLMQAPLGSDNAAGFGWKDMTVYKGGIQWAANEDWTFRAGYSYGKQPIPTTEVLFNILAPGVMEQHVTFGLTKAVGKGREFSLAIMRALQKHIDGPNPLEVPGFQSIRLQMNQWEFDISYSFGF
jgi:long-chain fatty acid transport protein